MNPDEANRRHRYICEKQRYRKIVYFVNKQSHETNLNDLTDLEHKDPKAVWNSVKKILAPSENCINSIAHS